MTKKEFRKLVVQGGYATSTVVTMYYKQNPKDDYTEQDDLIAVYRMNNSFASIKRKAHKKG